MDIFKAGGGTNHLACQMGRRLNENPCPKHWVEGIWVELGCLLLNTTQGYSWEDASNYCQRQNSSLVEIYNQEQMEFIQMELTIVDDLSGDHYWWTAGTDMGREGNWIWMKSLCPILYDVWLWTAGFPQRGLEGNCMALDHGSSEHLAFDISCTRTYYPICQRMI